MTRINCGIPVQELTDKHLLAEHREIKRIPNAIKSGRYNMAHQPTIFTLGTGHVKFFYDKLGYLFKRYCKLYEECKHRGFNITNFKSAWDDLPDNMMKDYLPTDTDKQIIRNRIKEKLNG